MLIIEKQTLNYNFMKRIIFSLFTLIFCLESFSQVTIGLNEAPEHGALLQLKNQTITTGTIVNATKGLMIPRVELTSKKKLYPIFNDTDSNYDSAAKQSDQHSKHTGLTVYATKTFELVNCPGLYVWDGEDWINLEALQKEVLPSFIDGEGNTYEYKRYGNLYWMTENVISTTVRGEGITPITKDSKGRSPSANLLTTQGSPFNGIFADITSKNDILNHPDISYISNGLVITESFYDNIKKFGLLYNYPQALEACPTGWRLPSLDEWYDLEKSIASMLGETPAIGSNTVYRAIRYPSENFGAINDTPIPWGGFDICSQPEWDIKFKAIPTGARDYLNGVWMFGLGAYFWTTTPSTTPATNYRAAIRDNYTGDTKIDYGAYSITNTGPSYTIRCVKEV